MISCEHGWPKTNSMLKLFCDKYVWNGLNHVEPTNQYLYIYMCVVTRVCLGSLLHISPRSEYPARPPAVVEVGEPVVMLVVPHPIGMSDPNLRSSCIHPQLYLHIYIYALTESHVLYTSLSGDCVYVCI